MEHVCFQSSAYVSSTQLLHRGCALKRYEGIPFGWMGMHCGGVMSQDMQNEVGFCFGTVPISPLPQVCDLGSVSLLCIGEVAVSRFLPPLGRLRVECKSTAFLVFSRHIGALTEDPSHWVAR